MGRQKGKYHYKNGKNTKGKVKDEGDRKKKRKDCTYNEWEKKRLITASPTMLNKTNKSSAFSAFFLVLTAIDIIGLFLKTFP